jgi:hypothetical protein
MAPRAPSDSGRKDKDSFYTLAIFPTTWPERKIQVLSCHPLPKMFQRRPGSDFRYDMVVISAMIWPERKFRSKGGVE